MKQKHSHFLIPGILLLGIVLRAPFTTLSTVLSDIASGLGVEVSSLGLLTSLPLLTFAIFSPFAASWAKRFGIEISKKHTFVSKTNQIEIAIR